VITCQGCSNDYLPSSWSYYVPTWVEIIIFIGTLGLFFTLFLIFTRVAPVVAIAEVKSILKTSGDQYVGEHAHHEKEAAAVH
ncbi:MAG: hydrogenase, partial [Bacteroidota bacterium]